MSIPRTKRPRLSRHGTRWTFDNSTMVIWREQGLVSGTTFLLKPNESYSPFHVECLLIVTLSRLLTCLSLEAIRNTNSPGGIMPRDGVLRKDSAIALVATSIAYPALASL